MTALLLFVLLTAAERVFPKTPQVVRLVAWALLFLLVAIMLLARLLAVVP